MIAATYLGLEAGPPLAIGFFVLVASIIIAGVYDELKDRRRKKECEENRKAANGAC